MGGPVADGGAEFGVELAVPEGACVWPTANLAERGPEVLLNFESAGGRPLTLVSNFPYELWLDGAFLGDGGHRCTPGEALADSWPEAAGARSVRVRLHWLDPERTVVFYRCLFDDPFFAELPPRDPWTCSHETSAAFGAKISGQLPRQTFTRSPAANEPLKLGAAAPAMPWRVIASPIRRPRYVLVEPIRTRSDRLESHQRGLFRPTEAEDAAAYVREGRPCELRCDTFDLGRIAPHRFEVDTGPDACVLVYSEVGDFESAAGTPSRAKVRLADAVAAGVRGAAPFGTRGCRYVNVVYPEGGRPPAPRVWRREYPIRWKRVEVAPEDAAVVEACRANLVACVDGGLTDTCWRERAQWTGDVRMSSAAMGALADNPEVVDLALHQIAQSYDPETGMVNGAWPVGRPGMKFPIPPFHLAFCLTALEHDPALRRDPLVRRVVESSFEAWSRMYLRDGVIQGMAGWYFTDWDPTDPAVAANRAPYPGPHAVCNAWWAEWCDRVSPSHTVTPEKFDAAFWTGNAYALTADKPGDSPHATAAALSCSASARRVGESLRYLEAEVASGRLAGRVTPYFACFVAKAFHRASPARATAFVRDFYGPIAERHGTIYEKTSAVSSMAHGWSVGIVPLLTGRAGFSQND